jgi:DnaJ-class molecular chaperone
MASSTNGQADQTGVFNIHELTGGKRCPDCGGTGELRIDSENINENFEVEKQTVITQCPRCAGTGHIAG